MAAFYFMTRYLSSETAIITDSPFLSGLNGLWNGGNRLEFKPDKPFEYQIDAENKVLSSYYSEAIPIMTTTMIEAMQKAGVDNLEVFDATVLDPNTDTVFEHYKSVNIVGTYAAADIDNSEYTNLGIDDEDMVDVFFDEMVLRDDIPDDLLLFRLAESTKHIVVHEKVRDSLIAHGVTDLDFDTEYG